MNSVIGSTCMNVTTFNTKVARKLAMVEADLERAEERAELGEKYVFVVAKLSVVVMKFCICLCVSFQRIECSEMKVPSQIRLNK